MSIDSELTLLKRLGFFRCLPEEQLRLVVFGAERLTLREGRELFRENQPADSAFVLLGGQIDLYRQFGEEMRNVRALQTGEMIGELALVSKTKRPVSAVAVETSTVLRISRGVFRRILAEYPESARQIRHYLGKDLRALAQKLDAAIH
ncbi:MAG: cAMP-dependent protein kinase [Candidatus Tokpelaia hoelldobleri]|uniref:cAMP-dependent protein kinase n=1 Tax=Candidatus Tokpelaia hoelldobleri TaxID=1902579 RepID=A0A1U9JWK5_9HYPH|nr:MAG: cAMP-dependent protein kinase [Candidatus Tokpelaia hoelldoblerii]